MREPGNFERAYFISTGDASLLVRALDAYLENAGEGREFRREQAEELRAAFSEFTPATRGR